MKNTKQVEAPKQSEVEKWESEMNKCLSDFELISNGTLVIINKIELASALAHDAARDEMLNDDSEMWVTDEEGNENYTEVAQEAFNRWYDYYCEKIESVKGVAEK